MESKVHLPPSLKPFLRFFAQANSLDSSNPAVAYFCRLFMVERILSSGIKEKDAKQFVSTLISKLEVDASHLGSAASVDEGQPLCEQFALAVFNRADEIDRSNQSDKSNALAFYASSVIMEVCQYFGPLSPDFAEKCKYAQFKCAEITKAVREGHLPIGKRVSIPCNDSVVSSVSATSSKPSVVDFITSDNPPSISSIKQPDSIAIPSSGSIPRFDESKMEQCARAERSCRLALSSLHFQDINSSISNLEDALSILRQFRS